VKSARSAAESSVATGAGSASTDKFVYDTPELPRSRACRRSFPAFRSPSAWAAPRRSTSRPVARVARRH
jgi:hypothetical protein